MRFSEFARITRTIVWEYGGETAKVTVDEGKVTTEFFQRADRATEGRDIEALARIVDELVEAWEIEDDDGNQLPATFEVACRFPLVVLSDLIDTILTTLTRRTESEGKASGGGSPQTA